jgi:hypothetical protein
MSEYGYIPEAPEQSFGNNKGIFTPKDIYDLTRADKYTNYGQLELIETQTVSSVSSTNFTNLGNYNVHFLTYNDIDLSTDANLRARLSNDGGSSYIASGYHHGIQRGNVIGTFDELRRTGNTYFLAVFTDNGGAGTNETKEGYSYFYNLTDNSKYSFGTFMSMSTNSAGQHIMMYGSSLKPTAETHNALQVLPNTGTMTGTLSLYGVKFS